MRIEPLRRELGDNIRLESSRVQVDIQALGDFEDYREV